MQLHVEKIQFESNVGKNGLHNQLYNLIFKSAGLSVSLINENNLNGIKNHPLLSPLF